MRMSIFARNYQMVKTHNSEIVGHTVALNRMSDWTDDELHVVTAQPMKDSVSDDTEDTNSTSNISDDRWGGFNEFSNFTVADSVDWRTKGVVTPVRNQMYCGSCYAFTSAALLESYYYIAQKKQSDTPTTYDDIPDDNSSGENTLEWFSPQQIVDCSGDGTTWLNQHCEGGYIQEVMNYA